MLEASGGAAGGSKAGSDLEKGVGALKRFQTRVNALLREFEDGAGGSSKVAAQRISRSSLSGANASFAEADGLYSQYNRVHEALVSLSKSLGDQIEMLSIAVHGAEVGFNNLEDDLRRRFHAIDARLRWEQETEARQAQEKQDAKHEPTPQNTNDDRTSESGW